MHDTAVVARDDVGSNPTSVNVIWEVPMVYKDVKSEITARNWNNISTTTS